MSTSAESLIRVAGTRSRRSLELYGVMHMDGHWYMVVRCLLRQEQRTFRLDRVAAVEERGRFSSGRRISMGGSI